MVWADISCGQRTQFECSEIPWRDPESHCSATHTPPSTHVSAWSCKELYTIHGSWKCPSSSMACLLTRSHPLSTFGMLWIYAYDSVFQFPPISSNFAQRLKSGTTFHRPQSTAWSTLCEGDMCCMRQMVATSDTEWFSEPIFFKDICDQQMDICIPSHVQSID
jgi:hypothetical protein